MAEDPTIDSSGVVHMAANAVAPAVSGAGLGAFAGPIGAAVGGGLGILGGFLSNNANRRASNLAYERQKEALQNSVQWRVADAKKAGIHPLYAMGQAPMSIAPMAFEDRIGPEISRMGQDVGNVIASQQTNAQKYQSEMVQSINNQMLLTELYKSEAELALLQNKVKRENTEKTNIASNGLGIQPEFGADPGNYGQGMIDRKAAEELSTKQDTLWSSAGKNPAYQLRYLDTNLPMYLPIAEGDSPEETISEMSLPAWAGLLQRNARIFGKGWMRDMINSRYMGIKPMGKYDPRAKRK